MKLLRFSFPFAFKKYDLAKYTQLTLWISLSLALSALFASLFWWLGSFWRYGCIAFFGLGAYDILSLVLLNLYFFEVIQGEEKTKVKKIKKIKQEKTATPQRAELKASDAEDTNEEA